MKIFTIKRVLGLAAIGGAVAYAQKHGGFKNAFKGLVAKKDELLKETAESTTLPATSKPASAYSTKGSL